MAGPGLLSSAFTTRFLPGLLKGEQAIIGALSRCGSVLEPSRRSPPSTSTIDQVAADASAKPDTLVQQHWRKHASDGLIVPWAASSRLAPEVPKPTIALWNHQLVSFSVAELLAAAPRPSPMQAPSSDLYSVPLQEVPVPVGQESGPLPDLGLPQPGVSTPPSPAPPPGSCPGATPAPLQCGNRGNTWQPSRRKRINKHGLEKRLSTPAGRETLLRRLRKGRWRITVDAFR